MSNIFILQDKETEEIIFPITSIEAIVENSNELFRELFIDDSEHIIKTYDEEILPKGEYKDICNDLKNLCKDIFEELSWLS